MLNDYSIYIDPEEDEVFFTAYLDRPIITVSKPNNSLADSSDEDVGTEDVFINKDAEANHNICQSPDKKSEPEQKIPKEVEMSMDNKSENDNPKNTNESTSNYDAVNPEQLAENSTQQENEFDNNVKEIKEIKPNHETIKIVKSPFKTPLKSMENFEKSFSPLQLRNNDDYEDKENVQYSKNVKQDAFKTPFKKSPLKPSNAKSSSKKKNNLSFAKVCDSSRISDFDLNADVNESIISWSSVDVNVQLENLMADLDFDEELLEESLCLSSTPQKVGDEPQLEFQWTRTGLDVRLREEKCNTPKQTGSTESEAVPSINIIGSTPAAAPVPSPAQVHFQKPMMPVRLVYNSAKKSGGPSRSGSSGSSSGSQTFATPRSTPLTAAKTFQSSIPKLSAKKFAPKSLQFPHIESPVSKYIYDKSTPLMSNVKSQKLASSNMPLSSASTAQATPKSAVAKPLPQARYQKGIPLRQEKPLLSKLPRLGANQMRVVSAVPSATVISHSPRRADVSVLMSSPAKINPKH